MDIRTELRISDDDREAMNRRLATAFAEGRISTAELEARVGAVLEATTESELEVIARDLPRPRRSASAPVHEPRPVRWAWPSTLLDVQLLIVTPVVLLSLLVAINTGTFLWPAWVWMAATAPIVLWLVKPAPQVTRRR